MSGENQELRKAGLKVTLPRVKIMQILENTKDRHLSAEDCIRRCAMPMKTLALPRSTAYSPSSKPPGLVMRHHFEGGHSVFEMMSDEHHDHIVCTKCGRVEEFIDEVIEQRQLLAAKQHGFTVSDHSLYIYGLCKNARPCQKGPRFTTPNPATLSHALTICPLAHPRPACARFPSLAVSCPELPGW